MKEYHKIQTVYNRDPQNHYKTLLDGEFARPEFDFLKNNEWVYTEKVDGTNIRVMLKNDTIIYDGKTDNAQIPASLIQKMNERFNIDSMKSVFPDFDVCLYGEGYGARIQKGGGNYIPDGVDFILFDVLINGFWLERHNVEDIATKLGIGIVPVIGTGTLLEGIEIVKSGYKSTIGSQTAEGLVMRPKVELTNRNGKRIITKIKHKDFSPKSKVEAQ